MNAPLRAQIDRELAISLDVARAWVTDARYGEGPDGLPHSAADKSAFVKQGRRLQWNALHKYRWQVKQLNRPERQTNAA